VVGPTTFDRQARLGIGHGISLCNALRPNSQTCVFVRAACRSEPVVDRRGGAGYARRVSEPRVTAERGDSARERPCRCDAGSARSWTDSCPPGAA
jgi:hypothetical protein